ncbi:MAG: MFS transporter [Bacillota bacterium]
MRQLLVCYDIFQRYPVMTAVGAVALLTTLGYAVIIPILPLYLKENLGFSASLIGLIFGAYAAAETLAKTPLGFVSDRIGRRSVIITGLLLCFPVPYLMTLPRHPVSLALLQMVNGAGVAAFWPALAALTADIVAVERRAQAMTVFNMSYLIGLGFGPALGTFVNHAAGSNTAAFYLASTFLAGAAIIGALSLPRPGKKTVLVPAEGTAGDERVYALETGTPNQLTPETAGSDNAAAQGQALVPAGPGPDAWEGLKALLRQPVLGVMLLVSLLQQFGAGFLAPVFVLFGREQVGFTQAEIGRILLFPALTIALLAIPLGRTADAIGKSRAVRCAFLAAALAIFLMPGAKHPLSWQFLVAVLGLAYVTGAPAWTALASMAAPPGRQGAAIAAIGTMQSLGFILGPGAGGFLYDRVAPAAPFYGCVLFLVVCFLLTSVLVSEKRIDKMMA